MMDRVALRLEHSVEVDVSPDFAWRYRTDVATWSDPPAKFALDGPFERDSRGTTLLPGQEPLHWCIRDVRPRDSFVLEMQLDGAVLTFEWRFEGLPGNRTKLTQQIALSGDNAETYAGQVQAGFGPTLAEGMERIATQMEAADT